MSKLNPAPKKTYPVADYVSVFIRNKLRPGDTIKAVMTGEKRPPKAGEWYISGAEPLAYQIHGDIETSYHIARLVFVRTVCHEVIEELPADLQRHSSERRGNPEPDGLASSTRLNAVAARLACGGV